ncbi:MAG: bifunctional metallophosphatase/5'-nucleotidase [Chloroflexi bacterium]|nr:bifunctional metallophosphatase/5'-nucleotidase [Chloroflexota bacterium]
MRRSRRLTVTVSLAVVLLGTVAALVAVRWWVDGARSTGGDRTDQPAFTLQLLHAGDMDGAVGALENVENFSALLDGFRKQFPDNTLVLSSGDNFVPGPRFYAAGDKANDAVLGVSGNGRGDIALLNAMGFQASALGNHELDRGTGAFAAAIGAESGDSGTYPGAAFPYLSSNLGFADDENLQPLVVEDAQEAPRPPGSLAASVIIAVGGERIGVVGVTTPHLTRLTGVGGISVAPADSTDMDELASIVQRAVDQVVGKGVNKVILLAHMQRLALEKELASKLVDVDIVVGGGSNTLLADENDRLRSGDEAADMYPLLLESASAEPLLLVNTDGDYRYLGRLVVGFDDRGVVSPESVDAATSGAYAANEQAVEALGARPIPDVSRIADSLRSVLRSRDGNVVGRTSVYLAGRRRDVRTQETNLGNLTADAFLWVARQVDPDVAVALKNGGGIRDQIGMTVQPPGTTEPEDVNFLPPQANPSADKTEGGVSQFDIEGALRFNNGLVIVPLTAQQLREIMEHAIGFDGVGEATVGRFPQIGGMRFSFDPAAPPGERLRSLAIVDDGGAVVDVVVRAGNLAGDSGREIKMVTLSFLANGGDGYPFPLPAPGRVDLPGEAGQINAPNPDFPDTNGNGVIDEAALTNAGLARFTEPGTEQDALAEYLAHFFAENPFDVAETPPAADLRVQNLGISGKQDTVLEPPADG